MAKLWLASLRADDGGAQDLAGRKAGVPSMMKQVRVDSWLSLPFCMACR